MLVSRAWSTKFGACLKGRQIGATAALPLARGGGNPDVDFGDIIASPEILFVRVLLITKILLDCHNWQSIEINLFFFGIERYDGRATGSLAATQAT